MSLTRDPDEARDLVQETYYKALRFWRRFQWNLATTRLESHGLAYQILAYLAAYPDAHDTLEGIVEWWLLEQHIKWQTGLVKDALEELVAEQWLLKREGHDARTHYELNRDKYQDIQALIKRKST